MRSGSNPENDGFLGTVRFLGPLGRPPVESRHGRFHSRRGRFANAIAGLSFCNPFLPERIAWERAALGDEFDERGPSAKEIQFINEPIGRNTAPAIGLAATYLKQRSPESIMLVMPSDHANPDREKFLKDVKVALEGAKKDYLVTFGIMPTHPVTGYGYIKVKKGSRTGIKGLRQVDKFVEKPDLKTAKAYLRSGNYYWNSGILRLENLQDSL